MFNLHLTLEPYTFGEWWLLDMYEYSVWIELMQTYCRSSKSHLERRLEIISTSIVGLYTSGATYETLIYGSISVTVRFPSQLDRC